MATKPTDTVPIWASNATWSTGPSAGSPTKIDTTPYAPDGHIEGVATPSRADVMNGFQNPVSKWCQWVQAGSSAGAADAHIVETDAAGKTTVKALAVTGPASGTAFQLTKVTALTSGMSATDGVGTFTVFGNTDATILEIGGARDGIYASVTGDHVPLSLSAQTTAPTTFDNGYAHLFAVQATAGGNTGTTLNTALRSTREYVATYENQHVRAYGTHGTQTADTTETDMITGVSWPARKVLHTSNVPILYTASFGYEAISTTITLTARVYIGATLIHVSNLFIESTVQEGSHIFRGVTTSTVGGDLGDFKLTIETSSGTCSIKTSVLTVETAN